MKKILLALSLFIAFSSLAQDKKILETDATRFYKNTVDGNYELLIADTYPKVFDFIPKDKMLESLKAMLKGDGYVMDVVDAPANFEFGEIKHIANGYYSIVKHDMLMKMTFSEPIGEAEANAMVQNFKKAMKTEEVTFNPRFNTFTMRKRADFIAILNEQTAGKWKFLNRSGEKLMAKVLDEAVRKQLGV